MLARQAGGSRRRLLTGTSAASFRISIISSKRAKVNTVTARGRIQSNYRARPGSLGPGRSRLRRPRLLPPLKVWALRSHHSVLGVWPRSGHQGLITQGAPRAQVTGFGLAVPSLRCVNSPRGWVPLTNPASFRALPTPTPQGPGRVPPRPSRRKPRPHVSPESCPPAPREDPRLQLVSPRQSIRPLPGQGPLFPKSHSTFAGRLACGSVRPRDT